MSTETDEFKRRVYDEAIAAGLSVEIARFLRDNVSSGSEARQRTPSEARAVVDSYAVLQLPASLAARAMAACRDPSAPIKDLIRSAAPINAETVTNGLRRAEVANTSAAYWRSKR